VRIREVQPESPAAVAGFRAGDVVLTYGGRPVRWIGELIDATKAVPAGRAVEVEIRRNGERRTLTLPAGRMGVLIENHRVE
jgi:S1-C subfamily serine protease